METITPTKTDFIATELKRFETEYEITESSLITLADSCKDLKVNGVDDKEGLREVETARKLLKKKRVDIGKISDGLRESAVKFQKAVIAREKELVGLIKPTEDKLEAIEDAIWQEKENIRKENERKESERIQNMLDKLNAVNQGIDFHTLKGMTDEQFNDVLEAATAKYEEGKRVLQEEQKRQEEIARIEEMNKRKEEARLAKEREKQEEERKALEKEKAEFKAEQDRIKKFNDDLAAKLKAAQDKIDAENLEKKRLLDLEEARKEAAEKARIEAEAKAKREAIEKEDIERREKEEAEQRLLFGEDSNRFAFLSQQLEVSFVNSAVWTHMKSKKGKVASSRVLELIKQARQICIENVKL